MALSWSTTPTPLGYNCYTQRRNRPLKANKHTHRAQHTSRGNRRCGCIITAAVALTTAAVYNKYPEVHMSKHSPRIDDPTASTTPRAPRHHLRRHPHDAGFVNETPKGSFQHQGNTGTFRFTHSIIKTPHLPATYPYKNIRGIFCPKVRFSVSSFCQPKQAKKRKNKVKLQNRQKAKKDKQKQKRLHSAGQVGAWSGKNRPHFVLYTTAV